MVVPGMASRPADADVAFAYAAVTPFDVPGIGLDARDPSRERVAELGGQHRDVVAVDNSSTRVDRLADPPGPKSPLVDPVRVDAYDAKSSTVDIAPWKKVAVYRSVRKHSVLHRIAMVAITAPRPVLAIPALVTIAAGVLGVPVAKALCACGFEDRGCATASESTTTVPGRPEGVCGRRHLR